MQEASGKTHTLQGTADSPGVVPRALDLLLGSAAAHPLRDSAAVQLSMLELHNDAVHDLLAQECVHAGGAQAELPKLELRSDSHGAVAVGTHACLFVCLRSSLADYAWWSCGSAAALLSGSLRLSRCDSACIHMCVHLEVIL